MAQIKIYEAKERANSWLPRGTSELLGSPRGREQGCWYIAAHTAAEAVEIAQRAGIPYADSPASSARLGPEQARWTTQAPWPLDYAG